MNRKNKNVFSYFLFSIYSLHFHIFSTGTSIYLYIFMFVYTLLYIFYTHFYIFAILMYFSFVSFISLFVNVSIGCSCYFVSSLLLLTCTHSDVCIKVYLYKYFFIYYRLICRMSLNTYRRIWWL